MAKNLRPCNFIVTKGGKEKSMSFDQMREYLLANPDVWMPASTRKIGAGKMQPSLGGREVPKAITVKDVIVKKSDDFANDGEYVVFDNDREIGRLWYDRSQKSWSNPNFYRPSAEPYSFKSIYGDVLGETKEDAVAEIVKRHNETKKEEKPKVSYVKDGILNNFLNILNDIKPLVVNPISQKEFVYDDRAALEFSRFNKGNLKEVELQDIAVFSKGKGEGMSVMKDITDAADKAGITLTLEAKPFGTGGLEKKDLINFYKKNGFVVDYEEAYGGEFDNEKDLIDYALENESEGVPMKRTPKEGAKLQASRGGRPVVGEISWVKSPEGKGDPSISERNPAIQKAAQDYRDSKISQDEFGKIIDENRPIGPITRFFEPATEQEVKNALSTDKKEKVGAKVENGEKVGLRLDIPAYKDKNTWVVSVHEGADEKTGKIISYTNVARVKNVKFVSNPSVALKIATGDVAKSTIARMIGEWQNIPGKSFEEKGEAAKEIIQDIADNPEWVQVGMNPFRHSYFYDRNQRIGQPIVNAEEVVQVGGLVYAKNPTYAEKTDEQFTVKGTNLQFSEGGRGEGPAAEDTSPISIADRNKAILTAGKAFTQAKDAGYKQEEREKAGIDAATKFLKEKGYTKKQIEEWVLPKLYLQYQKKAKEEVEGAIAISYIPTEMLQRIGTLESFTMEEIRDLGLKAIKDKTIDPKAIADSFANGHARPLNAIEVSALIAYKTLLNERYNRALTNLEKLQSDKLADPTEVAQAELEVLNLEQELENYYITSRKSAAEMGRAFRVRQMLLDKDLELVDIKLQYRTKFGAIPPAVMERLKNIDAEIKAIKEQQEKLNQEREEFERYKAMSSIVRDVQEENKTGKSVSKSIGEYISQNLLNKMAKVPSIFSGRKGAGQASVGKRGVEEQTDGEVIWSDAVLLAADVIGKTKTPTAEDKKKAIEAGSSYIKNTKWFKDLSQDDQKEALQAFSSFVNKETTMPAIQVEGRNIKIPHSTLRKYVEKVVAETDFKEDDPEAYRKLMTAVSKSILEDMAAELDPETTWQEIRDAITRYGIQTYPSKEGTEVTIRKIKAVGQKMAQLEALLSGKRPLKTGYQRDPQSPEASELQKEVNNLLKDLELTPLEQEQFLKTSLDRIKTSLKNRIEELKRQKKQLEETGKRTVRVKRATIYDDEANFLKQQIEELEKQVEALDKVGAQEKLEKKLDNAIATLVNSIADYKRRVRELDFSNFRDAKNNFDNLPKTPLYKQLQAERDQLRKDLQQLKRGPQKSPLEKRLEDLESEYDSLLDGTYQPKQPPVQYNDPRLDALRDKIKALKLQLGFAKTPEETRLERLRRELSDLQQGIIKTRTTLADTPESKFLKEQIKNQKALMGITQAQKIRAAEKQKEAQLRKIEQRINKLETTGQDVEKEETVTSAYIDLLNEQIEQKQEVVQKLLDELGIAEKKRLEAEKKRVKLLTQKIEERTAKGEFDKKAPKERNWDDEMMDLVNKKQAAYDKYEEEFIKADFAKKPWYKKGWSYFGDIVDLSKPLAAGLDLSAVLRQGLFEVLSQSPVTTAKAYAFMIESALHYSEKEGVEKYEKWLNSIKNSPMYYEMRQAGLYLAEPSVRQRATEENFVNRIINYVPIVQYPLGYGKYKFSLHLYSRSERAFNAFLNYMRVAAFVEASEALKGVGITVSNDKETYKAIADVINISTGRPSLGKGEGAATAINKFIFSVRLNYSRFMFLFLPAKAAFMPPAARRYALMKWGRVMLSFATITAMLWMYLDNDDDDETYVEIDPRGKFLNVNLDDKTSYNLTGGMSQFVSLITKLFTGEYKKVSTGEIRKLSGRGGAMTDADMGDVLVDFATGKASPSARFGMELLTAQPDPLDPSVMLNKYGERYDLMESARNLGTALMLQDAAKIIREGKPFRAAGLILGAIHGIGVNVKQDKYKKVGERIGEALWGDTKEREAQAEKFMLRMREGNVEKAKKILESETDTTLKKVSEKYKIDPDTVINGVPYKDILKNMYAYDAFKKESGDPLLAKTKLNKPIIRNIFFALMAETPLPDMPVGTPAEVLKEEYEGRAQAMEFFAKITPEDRARIIENYYRSTLEREELAKKYNELGTGENKIDFSNVNVGNNDYYRVFKFYENTPNFQKIIREYKDKQ
jgi:predicted RecB family endonuclease